MLNNCIVCGAETSGLRCRVHNGRAQAIEAAVALAEEDRKLLAMREEMSTDRMATRLAVSRNRIYQKLTDARRREKLRQAVEAE